MAIIPQMTLLSLEHDDGTAWEKIIKCFGYKLHLIVDSDYELPVAYEVTTASKSDIKERHKNIQLNARAKEKEYAH